MEVEGRPTRAKLTMFMTFRTTGFEIAPRTKHYIESRLLSAIGHFKSHIASVRVTLEASKNNGKSNRAVCEIAMNLHPSGEVRSVAEHSEMRVAVWLATADVRSELERKLARSDAATTNTIDRSRDLLPEVVLEENQASHLQRDRPAERENVVRPARVRERWRSHRDVGEDAGSAKPGRHRQRSRSMHGRWSRPFSRVY